MSICTRWWLRHCLRCQARKTPRLTVRWPVISIPLPPVLGIAVSVDYFGPFCRSRPGVTPIFFFSPTALAGVQTCSSSPPLNLQLKARPTSSSTGTFLFGGAHATSSRTTASSSAPSFPTLYMSFLVFEKSPPAPTMQAVTVAWSALTAQCPKCWLWSSTDAKTFGMRSYRTWSSPTTIRSAPPLAWPPTRFTWMGRLPRLPLTIFDRSGVAGHQSLARDHLAYCDLASECQQRANDIVREMHVLTISRVERRNKALSDALRQVPNFVVNNWIWLYNTTSTIRQGAKAGTDAKVLKTKFALNWTGPYKSLPSAPAPLATHGTLTPWG